MYREGRNPHTLRVGTAHVCARVAECMPSFDVTFITLICTGFAQVFVSYPQVFNRPRTHREALGTTQAIGPCLDPSRPDFVVLHYFESSIQAIGYKLSLWRIITLDSRPGDICFMLGQSRGEASGEVRSTPGPISYRMGQILPAQ